MHSSEAAWAEDGAGRGEEGKSGISRVGRKLSFLVCNGNEGQQCRN